MISENRNRNDNRNREYRPKTRFVYFHTAFKTLTVDCEERHENEILSLKHIVWRRFVSFFSFYNDLFAKSSVATEIFRFSPSVRQPFQCLEMDISLFSTLLNLLFFIYLIFFFIKYLCNRDPK